MERNSRKLIRMLEKDGWTLVATKGDHHQYKHPTKPGRVTVPHPNKDIPTGTVMSIYRQAGWR
jgi:predicted RNA binding protein YcfA (HicA-like mRNA interferase family)